jgi:hypothetical protein
MSQQGETNHRYPSRHHHLGLVEIIESSVRGQLMCRSLRRILCRKDILFRAETRETIVCLIHF